MIDDPANLKIRRQVSELYHYKLAILDRDVHAFHHFELEPAERELSDLGRILMRIEASDGGKKKTPTKNPQALSRGNIRFNFTVDEEMKKYLESKKDFLKGENRELLEGVKEFFKHSRNDHLEKMKKKEEGEHLEMMFKGINKKKYAQNKEKKMKNEELSKKKKVITEELERIREEENMMRDFLSQFDMSVEKAVNYIMEKLNLNKEDWEDTGLNNEQLLKDTIIKNKIIRPSVGLKEEQFFETEMKNEFGSEQFYKLEFDFFKKRKPKKSENILKTVPNLNLKKEVNISSGKNPIEDINSIDKKSKIDNLNDEELKEFFDKPITPLMKDINCLSDDSDSINEKIFEDDEDNELKELAKNKNCSEHNLFVSSRKSTSSNAEKSKMEYISDSSDCKEMKKEFFKLNNEGFFDPSNKKSSFFSMNDKNIQMIDIKISNHNSEISEDFNDSGDSKNFALKDEKSSTFSIQQKFKNTNNNFKEKSNRGVSKYSFETKLNNYSISSEEGDSNFITNITKRRFLEDNDLPSNSASKKILKSNFKRKKKTSKKKRQSIKSKKSKLFADFNKKELNLLVEYRFKKRYGLLINGENQSPKKFNEIFKPAKNTDPNFLENKKNEYAQAEDRKVQKALKIFKEKVNKCLLEEDLLKKSSIKDETQSVIIEDEEELNSDDDLTGKVFYSKMRKASKIQGKFRTCC